MDSNDALENEIARLASYNNQGYLENKDISQKRTIKLPSKFTHTSTSTLTYNKKYTKPQTNIKKEQPNKIENPKKKKKYERKMREIAIKYFRENAEKHEPYLSQLFDLIYDMN